MKLIPSTFLALIPIVVLYLSALIPLKIKNKELAYTILKLFGLVHLGTIVDFIIRNWEQFIEWNDLERTNNIYQFLNIIWGLLKTIADPIYNHGLNAFYYYIFLIMMAFAWINLFLFIIINTLHKFFPNRFQKLNWVFGNDLY